MDELVPVRVSTIGPCAVQTVNLRDLHSFLGVGRDFSSWAKARIEKYGFEEDVDYVTTDDLSSPDRGSSKSRIQKTIEYHASLDMAKELAMVENNDKGRQVRRYFIETERKYREARRPELTIIPDADGIAGLIDARLEVVLAEAAELTAMKNARDTARAGDMQPAGCHVHDADACLQHLLEARLPLWRDEATMPVQFLLERVLVPPRGDSRGRVGPVDILNDAGIKIVYFHKVSNKPYFVLAHSSTTLNKIFTGTVWECPDGHGGRPKGWANILARLDGAIGPQQRRFDGQICRCTAIPFAIAGL